MLRFYFCYCWCCGKIRRYNQLNWYATCMSDICRNPFHTVHGQDSTLPQLRNRAMYEASMIIWVHSICLELQLITTPPADSKTQHHLFILCGKTFEWKITKTTSCISWTFKTSFGKTFGWQVNGIKNQSAKVVEQVVPKKWPLST